MTYNNARIPSIILADDGTPNADDQIDVTNQISNNFDILANGVGILNVANQANLPVTNNYIGRLAQAADTGRIYAYNGISWDVYMDTYWQSYVPTWKGNGSTSGMSVGGGGVNAGKYKLIGKDIYFWMHFALGTAPSGGSAGTTWTWDLPIPADPDAYDATKIPMSITCFIQNNNIFSAGFISMTGGQWAVYASNAVTSTSLLRVAAGGNVNGAVVGQGFVIRAQGMYKTA